MTPSYPVEGAASATVTDLLARVALVPEPIALAFYLGAMARDPATTAVYPLDNGEDLDRVVGALRGVELGSRELVIVSRWTDIETLVHVRANGAWCALAPCGSCDKGIAYVGGCTCAGGGEWHHESFCGYDECPSCEGALWYSTTWEVPAALQAGTAVAA